MLLPDSETRKKCEFMRDELVKHPAFKLSQQVEHSVPLISAMVKRIQNLESEVETLKQIISKRDRQGEADLPDQRVSKKHHSKNSQPNRLFAAKPTVPDQGTASVIEQTEPRYPYRGYSHSE
jgi:hypothetical protein